MDVWIGLMSFGGTLLLVVVGLLNFSVFWRQLRIAQEQIQTAVRHLEIAQKQPELHLIQRAITETSDHARVLVERPYLRPYFYEDRAWEAGDLASTDEVKAMAELLLNNFASALMHSAAFPQYPVRGIDRIIMFHLRNSPALRAFLLEHFERFPYSGLTLLCLKNHTRAEVEADLHQLISTSGIGDAEKQRRQELLQMFQDGKSAKAVDFTKYTMEQRR